MGVVSTPEHCAAREYYEGAFATAREDGEILTAIRFEVPPAGHGCAYEKQKRKVGDYATAAAAVILRDLHPCLDRADQPRGSAPARDRYFCATFDPMQGRRRW